MEDTAQRYGSLRRLKGLSRETEWRAGELLSRLLESAMEMTEARRGLVVIFGPDSVGRVAAAKGAWPTRSLAERFAASLGSLGKLETGAAAVTAAPSSGGLSRGPRSVAAVGPGTAARVLLRAEGRLLGVIYVGGREPGSRLSGFDLEFLEALGRHAALVLAGFRLRRRIHRLLRGLRDVGVAPARDAPAVPRRRFAVRVGPQVDGPLVAEGRRRAV